MQGLPIPDLLRLAFGLAAGGLLGWLLLDALRTGRMTLRGGAVATRERNPLAFWFMAILMSGLLALVSYGCIAMLLHIVYR